MPTPTLGYGQQSEQTIDTVNQWMRSSDWYQTLIHSFGQDPRNVHLNDQQKQQVLRAAQAQGVVVDEGHMEIDPSGNFNPIGHKLRNTLIVAGLAAATIATMGAAGAFSGAAGAGAGAGSSAAGGVLEGTAAGAGGASTAVAAGVPAALGPTTAGTLAETAAIAGGSAVPASLAGVDAGIAGAGAGAGAFDAAGTFIGNSTYDIPADVAGAGGRTYADLLRYGLPVAGGLAGSLITANATSNASAAQQKYLEEALAYAKENDLYNRGVAAQAVVKEAARYGDYQGRIAPFIANGTTSNDRMASLLGLPARLASPSAPGGSYAPYGTATPTGVAVSPALTQRILDNYKTLGLTPTGPGSGPTDTAYYADKYAETGGSTPANDAYWFGPTGRIATDAAKAGVPRAPVAAPPAAPPVTGAPVARPRVQIRAPDGTVQSVPADQVDQYTQRGGTVLWGSA